jgi:4-amino-4-deoxy-L-arabinose transferase-like glycosyltransferase
MNVNTPPWHRYSLLAIFALYLALSLFQLDLPGLHYDEAFEAVPAVQLINGQPVAAFRNSGLTVGHRLLPLMTQDYIGALNTYTALPFIAALGPTPAALRLGPVLMGAITLWLTYTLVRQLSGQPWPGVAAAVILAVDPTFIFWNRQGIFVTAITAAIGLAAAAAGLKGWQPGRYRWIITAAFLLGFGLYAKFLFLWLIAALAGSVILLNLRQILFAARAARNNLGKIVGAGLAFLAGAAPLIAYNMQTGGTLKNIAQNAGTSYYGVNNLAFGPNLTERLGQFVSLLNGSHLWYLGGVVTNVMPAAAFGAMLIFVVHLAMRIPPPTDTASPVNNRPPNPKKAALFPFLVIALVLLSSIGTVSALWITHFALLMPWPAIAISLGGWYIYLHLKARRVSGRVLVLIWVGVSLVSAANLGSTVRYHYYLTISGGLSAHSDAVYDLSDWLQQHAAGPVTAMDWGLAAPVTYLTGGQVIPTEIFGYNWQPAANLTAQLETLINQPGALYLWRAPDEIIFDRSGQFKAVYQPLGLEENIENAFYERSGRPILGVTRLVPRGTAANPP